MTNTVYTFETYYSDSGVYNDQHAVIQLNPSAYAIYGVNGVYGTIDDAMESFKKRYKNLEVNY